jgi:hypothetical protein
MVGLPRADRKAGFPPEIAVSLNLVVHHHLPRYNWSYRHAKFPWIAELVISLFSKWDFTLCGESVWIMFYFWGGGRISKSMTLGWSLIKN